MAESQYLYGKIDSRNYELIIGGNYWSIYLFMGLTELRKLANWTAQLMRGSRFECLRAGFWAF